MALESINPLTHRPLEALADIEDTGGGKKNFALVKPVYLRKLQNKMQASEMAKALGYTESGLYSALNQNEVRTSLELAARFVYESNFSEVKKSPDTIAIVRGELHHLKTIKDLITGLGGTFSFVGDI